jgi:endoglucanase
MQKTFFLVLLLVTLILTPICESSADQARVNAMIHQSGTRLVDGNGKAVNLRGVNLEGWIQWEGLFFGASMFTSGSTVKEKLAKLVGAQQEELFERGIYDNFITERDISKIAELGFNCVRLPVTASALEGSQNPIGWELMDHALGWCDKYGVYAIIDLHSAPGGQSKMPTCEHQNDSDLLWNSEESRKRTVALWKAIAQRYRHRKIVAGYDLLNEPVAKNPQQLLDIYRRIISAIREVDPDHVVILEGDKLASDFSMFDRTLCDNQVYSFHMYGWFGDNRAKGLNQYKQLADSQNVPLWVGEFGSNTYEMIASTKAMYDRTPEIAGWAYWTWKKVPTKFPGLATITVPDDWKPIAKWLSFPVAQKPTAAQTINGMDAFVAATQLSNTPVDMRMVQVLTAGTH